MNSQNVLRFPTFLFFVSDIVGFAKTIWRNVRKRNKPSLWRHALRTYDRMTQLEDDPNHFNIRRANTHHEGAMLA